MQGRLLFGKPLNTHDFNRIMIMRKFIRILLLLIVSTAFFSCNDKDEKEPVVEYFIRATVNGEAVYFSDQNTLWSNALHYEEQHEFNIYGSIGEIIGITIQMLDNQPIAPGIYSGLAETDTHFEGVRIIYTDDLNNYITDANEPTGMVEITELTQTEIRGTFSGVLVNLNKTQHLTITNGQFFVRREN